MDAIELLSGVLAKTGDLIDGVTADQLGLPTPCDEYDVETLRDHLVGWLLVFAAGSQDRRHEGDASAYACGADPAGEFRAAAADLVAGWRTYGFDREVRVVGGKSPAEAVFNMALMEYMAHGWDLAVATGQPVPFTEQEAAQTLARAQATLPAEFRDEGMPFGDVVAVDEDASAMSRFVGFLGRRPVAGGGAG